MELLKWEIWKSRVGWLAKAAEIVGGGRAARVSFLVIGFQRRALPLAREDGRPGLFGAAPVAVNGKRDERHVIERLENTMQGDTSQGDEIWKPRSRRERGLQSCPSRGWQQIGHHETLLKSERKRGVHILRRRSAPMGEDEGVSNSCTRMVGKPYRKDEKEGILAVLPDRYLWIYRWSSDLDSTVSDGQICNAQDGLAEGRMGTSVTWAGSSSAATETQKASTWQMRPIASGVAKVGLPSWLENEDALPPYVRLLDLFHFRSYGASYSQRNPGYGQADADNGGFERRRDRNGGLDDQLVGTTKFVVQIFIESKVQRYSHAHDGRRKP
ncbi:hypothetical protein BJ322DRAFT_1020306 [Thelephora terrestris]|uniref:Uncharacterized protein n=1 Tax=Thelephora terrestris TaxID=56493 RepID=A0A9P6HG60_9AGAM|nr:hypothetical protein BJ322DRAFT_1020306 [Thelephora terrestris]